MNEQQLEVLKQWARDRLISFSAFCDSQYNPQPFHYQIAEKLEAVERGEIKRLMIFMPPRAWKSRLSTQLFTSRYLGRNPTKKLVVAWYWQDLPNYFSRETQSIITGGIYSSLFTLNQTTTNVSHWETQQGWYYHAVWVGWPLTWYWFDIGIIDDPIKNREEAESMVYRQKVWDWYTSTFLTRKMDDKAAIILILTRWHIDDLAGRLLQQAEEWWQQWDVISIPAIKDWESFRPSRFSVNDLLQQKDSIGVRDFAALYMQDPILSTGSIFKPSDFRYFLLSDFERVDWINKKDIKLWIFIDPAFSTNQSSDDAVVMVCWWHLTRNELYVFDIYADTSAPSKTIDSAFNLADRWKMMWFDIEFFSVENVSINKDQMKFKETLKQEMSNRNQYYSLYEFNPKGKKKDRIKFQLEPMISLHKCFFIRWHGDFSSFKRLEEQLTLFPATKKDDIIDTLAQAKQVFSERGKSLSPKKDAQPRYYFNNITGKLEQIK